MKSKTIHHWPRSGIGEVAVKEKEINNSLMLLLVTVYTPSTASTAVDTHVNAQITDGQNPPLLLLPSSVYTGNAGRKLAKQGPFKRKPQAKGC